MKPRDQMHAWSTFLDCALDVDILWEVRICYMVETWGQKLRRKRRVPNAVYKKLVDANLKISLAQEGSGPAAHRHRHTTWINYVVEKSWES